MSDWPYWAALAGAYLIAAVFIIVRVRRSRRNNQK